MKKWVVSGKGAALEYVDAKVPTPAAGELLIKVSAVSLNAKDKWIIAGVSGMALPYPFVPASDMAGVVVERGGGAAKFKVGDRVISTFEPAWIEGARKGSARLEAVGLVGGSYQGVLAQYVTVPEHWVVAAPQTLTDLEASTLPVAGLTAWSALVNKGKLQAREFVLIHGTGGVAMFGIQIARSLDAKVIVTSRGSAKFARAKAAGATHLVDSSTSDWVQSVIDVTDGAGVNVVLETIGGANVGASLEATAVEGRICLVGGLAGFDFSGSSMLLMSKQVSLLGVNCGNRRSLISLGEMIDRTGLHPIIDTIYPLDALPAALKHMDSGPVGKIVVQID